MKFFLKLIASNTIKVFLIVGISSGGYKILSKNNHKNIVYDKGFVLTQIQDEAKEEENTFKEIENRLKNFFEFSEVLIKQISHANNFTDSEKPLNPLQSLSWKTLGQQALLAETIHTPTSIASSIYDEISTSQSSPSTIINDIVNISYSDRYFKTPAATPEIFAPNLVPGFFSIFFNPNGGVGDTPIQIELISYNQNVILPTVPNLKKSGFKFVGWGLNNGAIVGNHYVMPYHNVILYAQWVCDNHLKFDFNGGENEERPIFTYCGGQELDLSNSINPVRNNYKFLGWSTSPSHESPILTHHFIMPLKDVTLYAQWECDSVLHFDANGGSGVVAPIRGCAFYPIQLPDPNGSLTYTYFEFIGWATNQSETTVLSTSILMPLGNTTLYAKWKNRVDRDGNGLIEIYTLDELNQVRWNLEGSSWKTSANAVGDVTGCPSLNHSQSRCRGYELMQNLDFNNSLWASGANSMSWEPIGNSSAPFVSTFSGNGFEIRNLYIDQNNLDMIGLFGKIALGSEISNLGIVNARIHGKIYTGGLVGYMDDGLIYNTYTTGLVEGYSIAGGLVGIMYEGEIKNSFSKCAVRSFLLGAGFLGFLFNGRVNNIYATGSVLVTGNYAAGLIARHWNGSLENAYSTGGIQGNMYLGGAVGQKDFGNQSNLYWDQESSGVLVSAGGTGYLGSQMKDIVTSYPNMGPSFFYSFGSYPKLCKAFYTPCNSSHLLPMQ